VAFVFDLQGLAVADILQRRARKQSKSPRSNEVMFDPGFRADEKVRRDKLHRRGKKEARNSRAESGRVFPAVPCGVRRLQLALCDPNYRRETEHRDFGARCVREA